MMLAMTAHSLYLLNLNLWICQICWIVEECFPLYTDIFHLFFFRCCWLLVELHLHSHLIYNYKAGDLICRRHSTIVPSTGTAKDEFANRFVDHFRCNHPDLCRLPGSGFYHRILESLNLVYSVRQFRETFSLCVNKTAIQGIDVVSCTVCQCGYCGIHKVAQNHARIFHHSNQSLNWRFSNSTYTVHMFLWWMSDPQILPTPAWQSLHDKVINQIHPQGIQTDANPTSNESKSLSPFVRSVGWAGCIERRASVCEELTEAKSSLISA